MQNTKVIAEIASAVADIFTVVGGLTVAGWAFLKFRTYEIGWLATQAQPALEVTVKGRVLGQGDSEACVLALSATVTNRGKVNAVIDLDRSWFLVELASEVLADEGAYVEGVDGKKYLVHDSMVDIATNRLRLKLGNTGLAVIRAGVCLSQASVCPVVRGIYRVRVEYALSSADLKYFNRTTGSTVPAPDDSIVWSASTIVDARALPSQPLQPTSGDLA